MKIKIHPLFIVVAALTVWKFGLTAFLSATLAALLHERAHAFAARQRGYVLEDITLLPYGAVLYNRNNLDKLSNVIIAVSGPLSNFAIALCAVAFWWLVPESFAVTRPFVNANCAIGFFNLLPVWPLDGGRVLFALFSYKPRALKGLKISACALAVALIIVFFTIPENGNFTLIVMAAFLLTGAISKSDCEDFAYTAGVSPVVKDYQNGAFEETVRIDGGATLKKALLLIKPNRVLTFIIMENGVTSAVISEKDMQEIFNTNNLNTKLSDAIRRCSQKA